MQIRAQDVAAFLGGSVVGDADTLLSGIAGLNEAKTGDLSFLANPKYGPMLATTQASAVLVAEAREGIRPAQIVVTNPDLAFAKLVTAFGPKPIHPAVGVHPTAVIGERVQLGANVRIGPQAVVGDDAVIGDGTVLYPQVVIGAQAQVGSDCVLYAHASVRERCRLGSRVILQPGAVIGSDGFGYALQDGKHTKIPQVGIVVVEDDVEIGANTTIDRARFGKTRIGAGTKIDNLVQIAHNVETGSHCIIVAQVGIAGSTRIGAYCQIGGAAMIIGHLNICDRVTVSAGTFVAKDIREPGVYTSVQPLMKHEDWKHNAAHLRHLDALVKRVKSLEAKLKEN